MRDLTKFTTAARSNGFSTVKGRQATQEEWGKLEMAAPFDVDKRFPGFGTFICLDAGDWPGKEAQLLSSLDFKEASEQGEIRSDTNATRKTENDKKEKQPAQGHEPHDGQHMIGQDTFNKTKQAWSEAIRRMNDQSYRGDHAYNISKFETEMGLIWSDGGDRHSITKAIQEDLVQLISGSSKGKDK